MSLSATFTFGALNGYDSVVMMFGDEYLPFVFAVTNESTATGRAMQGSEVQLINDFPVHLNYFFNSHKILIEFITDNCYHGIAPVEGAFEKKLSRPNLGFLLFFVCIHDSNTTAESLC